MKIPHIPVLPQEIIDSFVKIDGVVIDCTVGYGGHSELLLESNPNISLICNDRDDEALDFSKQRLAKYGDRVKFIKGEFSTILERVEDLDNIRGVLADIGVSSLQLDKDERGFGFGGTTLDMRMDTSANLNAKDIVNGYSLKELERILKDYGEVREYKKVASAIVQRRKNQKFQTSKELAEFLSTITSKGKLHPATLPFQAIRIEVNNELGEIKQLLENIKQSTINNALVAIISFHSLEDRVVKQSFKNWSNNCICDSNIMRCECGNNHSLGKIITKKPILASSDEIKSNPRARSSKMRLFHINKLKEE
jgi:16S rRNA (cytosine1402-N4)-methyltransferase